MTRTVAHIAAAVLCLAPSAGASAQSTPAAHKQVLAYVDQNVANYKAVSKQIWDYAELGFHETKSSALLQSQLKSAGFSIKAGVADEPTAFIASYGSGSPVIAILGEFDALPGLSQKSEPTRDPVVADAPGHACGHNLLGSGAALAAVAVKDYMAAHHIAGTLRYYGTPAEEGGSGKVYMVRDGLFKDVDVVLHWHPSDHNGLMYGGTLASTSAKFTFHGIAAHAAAAPERGRSALDAVMLMGDGIEFLREHVPSATRMHYIITRGGVAPNVVPDLSQLYLMARNPSGQTLSGIWDRILKISQGAALMTGTTVDVKVIGAYANLIPNAPLAALAQKNLEEVGGWTMNAEQKDYALKLQKTLGTETIPSLDLTDIIQPLAAPDPGALSGSTDVGDISWNVPTIGIITATFVPGVAAHTWQAAASTGMSIGQDGMVVASRALALTAIDLFTDPQLVQAAKADFAKETAGKTYLSAIPAGQKPPMDYYRED
jgi:aminobenzoyl-glutamate utilization protein B